MAWLEEENGIYLICFRYQGERVKRSARTRSERKALSMAGRVEENIELVERGRLNVPDDADLFAFLLTDGHLNGDKPKASKQLKLSALFDRYRESLPVDSLSPETLRIAKIHMGHFVRIIGRRKLLRTVQRHDLQQFVNIRSEEIGKRGKPVSPGTVKKELSTLRTLWRWARQSEYVNAAFPNEGLRFPVHRRKLPFSTWDQIELRIKRGIPEGQSEADYWDCLYLSKTELDELLSEIEKLSTYEFLYPMAFLAAHTGARRSELCRSMRDDVDFETDSILIRERKRERGKETFRHVPMSATLRTVLSDWFSHSPLCAYAFPAEHHVSRARNRNRRENDYESVSPDEATDHLEQTLRGTRWERIRGWHVFRHSFISNCASLSVDQRMIDAWVGHQTDEMRRRYRHLFPNRQKMELEKVFG